MTFIERAAAFGHPGLLKRSVFSFPDGEKTIRSLLGGGKYKNVIEIGTYRGVTAAFMATLCERVTTVDLHCGQIEKDGDGFDRSKFWNHMGVKNIDLVLVENDADKRKKVGQLDFDFAFIDGGLFNVASDFDLVRRCGNVLFHDYDTTRDRKIVFDFVNTLPASQVTPMGMFALWSK